MALRALLRIVDHLDREHNARAIPYDTVCDVCVVSVGCLTPQTAQKSR